MTLFRFIKQWLQSKRRVQRYKVRTFKIDDPYKDVLSFTVEQDTLSAADVFDLVNKRFDIYVDWEKVYDSDSGHPHYKVTYRFEPVAREMKVLVGRGERNA